MEEKILTSAYCIVEKNNKILLTKDEGKPGYKIPGGKIESHENIIEGVKRELFEETGYKVEITHILEIHEYFSPDSNHRLRFYFLGKVDGGEEKPLHGEVKQIDWVSSEALKKLKRDDFFLETYYFAVNRFVDGDFTPMGIFRVL